MDFQDKERIAQEKYGKSYEQLSTNEKKAVGGSYGGPKGGEARKEQMAGEHGGDVHEAYAEMGKSGGETRKEQMASEHGGNVHEAYSEMGSTQRQ